MNKFLDGANLCVQTVTFLSLFEIVVLLGSLDSRVIIRYFLVVTNKLSCYKITYFPSVTL